MPLLRRPARLPARRARRSGGRSEGAARGGRLVTALGLVLLGSACLAPPPGERPAVAVVVSEEGATIVTDYAGQTAPVARYVRLPDGRIIPAPLISGEPPAGPPAPAPPPPAMAQEGRPLSSGSAFAIARSGMAVTNAHVVQGCAAIADEAGRRLRLRALDAGRDLALLETDRSFAAVVRFRPRAPVELGEPVFVFGFPYGQALGTGLNVTNGIITGLTGPGGNARLFQMNAAVQPGNSGGPVVDESGQLIGVAVGRLNDLAVLRATGTLPQGVNFAIRASEVERFLAESGLRPERGPAGGAVGSRAVAAAVAPAVFQVLCLG